MDKPTGHQPSSVPTGTRMTSETIPSSAEDKLEIRQPAKITMNIPTFMMPKIAIATSPVRTPHVDMARQRLAQDTTGTMTHHSISGINNIPKSVASPIIGGPSSVPPVSAGMPTQGTFQAPLIQMKLDPGSFRSGVRSPSFSDRPSGSLSEPPLEMMNRSISQQQLIQQTPSSSSVNELPVSRSCQEETTTLMTPITMSYKATAPAGPAVSLTICKPNADEPSSKNIGIQQHHPPVKPAEMFSSNNLTNNTTSARSAIRPPTSTIISTYSNVTAVGPVQPTLVSVSPLLLTTQTIQLDTSLNNNTNSTKTLDYASSLLSSSTSSLATTVTVVTVPNFKPPEQHAPQTKIPVSAALVSNKTITPDKNLSKLRGPKCFREPEESESKLRKASPSPRPSVRVSVGPYQVPVNIKRTNITREDIAMLVMPSEDWSCSVYPAPNYRQEKFIYVISETFLNSDLVEIVRKSISILPNWGMKFSVMAKDMSRFNLGLDVSDITDIQAVLNNFDAFPVCNGSGGEGIRDSSSQSAGLSDMMNVTLYSDRKCRSKQCPLLLLNFSDTKCTSCLQLFKDNKI
ncbi:uncharacterized protein LOC118434776 [Folsomia candida]|uniref:uncharacterized protein LOC118434776 n=1 Tax=Folsomia candida TaxID=158441 RepID=UPI001604ADD8|nr:uncharacterized protein LOC118434776 [Folsomia candida]XP_035704874.1 uncharacterized protein LOC118434776 [Folsomia candida]